MPAPDVDETNFHDYFNVKDVLEALQKTGYDNVEPRVMDDVITWHRAKVGTNRTLVIFISDGGIGLVDRSYRGNVNQAIKASVRGTDEEIFWAFAGIAGSDYGPLKKLDDLTERNFDNSSFFAVDRIDDMSDDKLYEAILLEFAPWIKALVAAGKYVR